MPYRDRTLTSFGRNVARIRGERGFSQDKLAEKADLDRTYEHDQFWEVFPADSPHVPTSSFRG